MLDLALEELIRVYGLDAVSLALGGIRQNTEHPPLIIVPNAGSHPIPAAVEALGEVWAASSGALDLSNSESACSSYVAVLRRVIDKLSSRPYGKIYILPFGPATLTAQVKMLVYRYLHISTIDLLHINGSYFEIDIDQRGLISNVKHKEA